MERVLDSRIGTFIIVEICLKFIDWEYIDQLLYWVYDCFIIYFDELLLTKLGFATTFTVILCWDGGFYCFVFIFDYSLFYIYVCAYVINKIKFNLLSIFYIKYIISNCLLWTFLSLILRDYFYPPAECNGEGFLSRYMTRNFNQFLL